MVVDDRYWLMPSRPIFGAPYVYRSVRMPWERRTPAAREARAPPREWPVATTLYVGYWACAFLMAATTLVWASSHEAQNPVLELHVEQIVVGMTGNCTFVSQLRTERDPRKERTMSLFVESVATKPVTSDLMEFSNSVKVLVLAASTRAQFPWGQVILVLGLLLFTRQYAAAEYWLKNCSWSRTLADTAEMAC